jgi:hypothetical protein
MRGAALVLRERGVRMRDESSTCLCDECERLKQSHSSAVNQYGEVVRRLSGARGADSKLVREHLRKATETCERTKLELLSHRAQCAKVRTGGC